LLKIALGCTSELVDLSTLNVLRDFLDWARLISCNWDHLEWVTGGAAGDDSDGFYYFVASLRALTPR
jgi:hypothetical protein